MTKPLIISAKSQSGLNSKLQVLVKGYEALSIHVFVRQPIDDQLM